MTEDEIGQYLEETKHLTDEQKFNDPTSFKIFMSVLDSQAEQGPYLDADEFFGYKPGQAAS